MSTDPAAPPPAPPAPAPLPPYRVLIADDEPDVHSVTRLSLKGLRRAGRALELLAADSGKAAVDVLRANPDVAVILLDVVMETDSAGLDACRAIREELKNPFVRILLRTGQPGAAPEKQTIDTYDIDGYLPKQELTSHRLYTAVRTALKAHGELWELERHRRHLAALNQGVLGLGSSAPLDQTLGRILDTAVKLCPAPLAVLQLESLENDGNPRRSLLHRSTDVDALRSQAAAQAIRSEVAEALRTSPERGPRSVARGFLVPVSMHRELGHGWIYVQKAEPDELERSSLVMLASHAANALYATLTETLLRSQRGPVFDEMPI